MITRDILPETVHITKLVHGGQGLGILSNGKKVFVWNALPGEDVRVRVTKQRRSYAEAIAEEIVRSSPERIEPKEMNYLATSPWQIMTFQAENHYKQSIVTELFEQAEIELVPSDATVHDNRQLNYRNKMEYSFWGDDDGLHLAFHQRGSHGKQIVTGSILAMAVLDKAANDMCKVLGEMQLRAGTLKTIIVRCDQAGSVVASLFVRSETFPDVVMPTSIQGLRVYFSNPKSPASVPTKLLNTYGDCMLEDILLGKRFAYDVDSFFQVNIPVFELALQNLVDIYQVDELVDMYAGVGSIGLSIAKKSVALVELDASTAAMARINVKRSDLTAEVIEASAEKSLECIVHDKPVLFDPPRAGLHDKVVERILDVLPPKIAYLSCNPATQARDLAKLQMIYVIDTLEIFNFFPRTPHIETLVTLSRKN